MSKKWINVIFCAGAILLAGLPIAYGATPTNEPTSKILQAILSQLVSLNTHVNTVNSSVTTVNSTQNNQWNAYLQLLHAARYESATTNGQTLLLADSGYTPATELLNVPPMTAQTAVGQNQQFYCNLSAYAKTALCEGQGLLGENAFNLVGSATYSNQLPDSYVGNVMSVATSPDVLATAAQQGDATSVQYPYLSMVQQTLSAISHSRKALGNGKLSEMGYLKQAVQQPLQGDWLKQIGTASNQQVLRSIAIMLAVNNYLQYKRLEQNQRIEMLLAGQLNIMLASQALQLEGKNKANNPTFTPSGQP